MAVDQDVTGVTLLGATGTIGINTLDVLERHCDRFRIVALTANTDVDRLYQQCLAHRPEFAVMSMRTPPGSCSGVCALRSSPRRCCKV